MQRLPLLQANRHLLTQIRRGIERETLRINPDGHLALTPHPAQLGAALTNEYITTDYSESLLEFITQTHTQVDDLLDELKAIHSFALNRMSQELLWLHSMPCELPKEEDIPIAWYGKSNVGQLKHVYREGLSLRYGRAMQCIAGLHYNFSLPSEFWSTLGFEGETAQDRQSNGYMALIRNFSRYSWLLMYLFGASPALNESFLAHSPKNLPSMGHQTCYRPNATSLRMSDLGYQNNAQTGLKSCYNSIENYVNTVYKNVTRSWPAYEKLGTQKGGKWQQLNTHILQIENELYTNIRPKRTVKGNERPNTVLMQRGVQYVEIRCLDIDPFDPIGISPETCYFMDAFLVYCATQDSPLFEGCGSHPEGEHNFNLVVNEGRKASLQLQLDGQPISLKEWGLQLLEKIKPIALELDIAFSSTHFTAALNTQRAKLQDVGKTPSALFLEQLKSSNTSFNDFVLKRSLAACEQLRSAQPKTAIEQTLSHEVQHSIDRQTQLENNDDISFEQYLKNFEDALTPPQNS